MKEYIERERYYSESLLRGLAYDDDVNGNCDGMIDFTVIDCISGADVAPVVHGEWIPIEQYNDVFKVNIIHHYECSNCKILEYTDSFNYCPNCGTMMRGD